MTDAHQTIERTFTLKPSDVKGRMIIGRCVPYDETASIPDEGFGAYQEMFKRGAFKNAVRAPHKVLLSYEHGANPLNLLGRGVELVERDDGLHGTFKAFETETGNQGLAMVEEGVLTGLSVRALVLAHHRRTDGVVVRTRCALDHVALCREPAYASAVVEALRSIPWADKVGGWPLPAALAELRPERDSDLDDRLRALGVGAV